MHLRGDESQIFRDEGKLAEYRGESLKKTISGTFNPPPIDGRFGAGRDFIVFLKTAEVIDAYQIDLIQHASYAIDPPLIAGPLHGIPAIQRIIPKLAGSTEVIRRNSGHRARPALLVQIEKFRIAPHIRAVQGDEYRQVAENPDPPIMAVFLEGAPLAEEFELDILVLPHLLRIRVPLAAPLCPDRAAVLISQGHEFRVVVEPESALRAELLEFLQARRRALGKKGSCRLPQKLPLEGRYGAEVDRLGGKGGRFAQVGRGQETVVHQQVQADQKGIARHA